MVNLITVDPAICHGKPCIRGLRYTVESVLEWLATGMSMEEILADYPDLNKEDILAVLSYPRSASQKYKSREGGLDDLEDFCLADATMERLRKGQENIVDAKQVRKDLSLDY